MQVSLKRIVMTAVTLSLFAPAMYSFALEQGEPHPRVHQVNRRLRRQNRRIKQGLKNGTLTQQQAQQLRSNDQAINAQKKADIAANGGEGLTKAQQGQLNQEENANSKMIYDEKHPAGQ